MPQQSPVLVLLPHRSQVWLLHGGKSRSLRRRGYSRRLYNRDLGVSPRHSQQSQLHIASVHLLRFRGCSMHLRGPVPGVSPRHNRQ